jgi:hypothetical protein
VNTAIWDLSTPQRIVVMVHYGFDRQVWRLDYEIVYENALKSLFLALKNRVAVCN